MSTTQAAPATFAETFARASLLPLYFFLAIAAYLVPSALFASAPAVVQPSGTESLWKASYSEKYPGCVSTVLWPSSEMPVALVVVTADGETAMLSRDEARSSAAQGQVARTIGACRVR